MSRFLVLVLSALSFYSSAREGGSGCPILGMLGGSSWQDVYIATVMPDAALNPVGTAAFGILGERYIANDAHAVALTKIGWKLVHRDGKTLLTPPNTPEETCLLFRAEVAKKIAGKELDPEDAIDLAIPFERKTLDKDGSLVFMFVRPGLDPWPNENEWQVANGARQLSHSFFYSVVASGRFPIFPGNFYYHDLAHATEMLDSAEIMRQTRRYAKSLSGSSPQKGPIFHVKPEKADQRDDMDHRSNAQRRSHILSEWLSVPNIAMAPAIRALVPEAFKTEETTTIGKHILVWDALPSAQIDARASKLVREVPALLLKMGGGLRDTFNLQVYAAEPMTLNNEVSRLRQQLSDPEQRHDLLKPSSIPLADPPFSGEVTPAMETLHGQLYLLKQALAERAAIGSLPEEFRKQRGRELDLVIRDIGARLEVALAAAVQLQITPDVLVRDSRLNAPEQSSGTFQYFKSYARPDGFTYYSFELHRGSK